MNDSSMATQDDDNAKRDNDVRQHTTKCNNNTKWDDDARRQRAIILCNVQGWRMMMQDKETRQQWQRCKTSMERWCTTRSMMKMHDDEWQQQWLLSATNNNHICRLAYDYDFNSTDMQIHCSNMPVTKHAAQTVVSEWWNPRVKYQYPLQHVWNVLKLSFSTYITGTV